MDSSLAAVAAAAVSQAAHAGSPGRCGRRADRAQRADYAAVGAARGGLAERGEVRVRDLDRPGDGLGDGVGVR